MSIKNREWAITECKSPFPGDRHVLLVMGDHTDDNNLCHLSVSRIMRETGMSRRGVQYARNRLEIVGNITRVDIHPQRRTTIYRLNRGAQ